MEIVEFKPEHVAEIGGNVELYTLFASKGLAYTAMNGRPVFCGGGVVAWPGVAEIWFLPGPDVRKHLVSLCKLGNKMIADGWPKKNIHRLQATVKATDIVAINFARHFGFEIEGVLKKYSTDQQDYVMMARYEL